MKILDTSSSIHYITGERSGSQCLESTSSVVAERIALAVKNKQKKKKKKKKGKAYTIF
jgi:hypothetical protein